MMFKCERHHEIATLLCRKGWALEDALEWLNEFEDVVGAIYDAGYCEGYEEAAIETEDL
jgi:hypothetical protein